jgi:hypothetical protein
MTQNPTSQEKTTQEIYADCMVQLRERLDCIDWLVTTATFIKGEHFFVTELVFVQLRKALELLALSSMAAHKEQYSAAYTKFREHWRAKKILEALAKVNPDFYPKAVRLVSQTPIGAANSKSRFHIVTNGTLTKEEFSRLYDASAEVLHTRNPFSEKPLPIDIGYSVPDWVRRIRALIRIHTVLMSGVALLVDVPDKGNVRVRTVMSNPPVIAGGLIENQ